MTSRCAADVDRAVAAARAAFPAWRRPRPSISRSQIFFAYRELVWRHRERACGPDHARSRQDLARTRWPRSRVASRPSSTPAGCRSTSAGMNTPNVSTKVDTLTLRQPLGVAAGITPFNFPAMVPMWIYPIALACGNTFIWKPSSHTPGATQLQAELWAEAGLPDGVFNIVYGGREAVDAMLGPSRDRRDRVRRLDDRGPARPRDRDARGQAGRPPTRAPRTRWSSCPTPTSTSRPTPPWQRATARPASGAWRSPWSSPSATWVTGSGH